MNMPKVLFICGSLNQTTQLHAVAKRLPEVKAVFTPYYADGAIELARKAGLLERTILGSRLRERCLSYLLHQRLAIDVGGEASGYDLVVTSSDVIVPKNVQGKKLVLVQEGILDPERVWFHLRQLVPLLPRWTAGTAWTGTSPWLHRACMASEGYRQLLLARGVPEEKVVVTGMPNFDDCERYRDNDFPHRGYVLACTSDGRETFKWDNRPAFLAKVRRIASGRQVIVKLHPNEKVERATREVNRHIPGALVYASGSAEEMIANCDVLVTEWSSTAFVGLALGKEVHSNYTADELRRLLPVQNGGTSAHKIARVCRDLLGLEEPSVVPLFKVAS